MLVDCNSKITSNIRCLAPDLWCLAPDFSDIRCLTPDFSDMKVSSTRFVVFVDEHLLNAAMSSLPGNAAYVRYKKLINCYNILMCTGTFSYSSMLKFRQFVYNCINDEYYR